MPTQELRFVLVVDAATGLVKSVSEIDQGGHELQALIAGKQWISVASQDGSATTVVLTTKKDSAGKFPARPIIQPGP